LLVYTPSTSTLTLGISYGPVHVTVVLPRTLFVV